MKHYVLYSATFNKYPEEDEYEKCGSTYYSSYDSIEDAKNELDSEVIRAEEFYGDSSKLEYKFLDNELKILVNHGYKLEVTHYKVIEFDSEF